MLIKQPKKLLILNILDILRKYSDEDQRPSGRRRPIHKSMHFCTENS